MVPVEFVASVIDLSWDGSHIVHSSYPMAYSAPPNLMHSIPSSSVIDVVLCVGGSSPLFFHE